MNKHAIITICGGTFHKYMATFTHPSIKAYAGKCEAEFISIDSSESCDYLTWGKFKLKNYLQQYDRVLYVDTDIIVTKTCGNIFDLVPDTHVGMFNEYLSDMAIRCTNYTYPEYLKYNGYNVDEIWDRQKYYNSGVILFSKGHEQLFTEPNEHEQQRERELSGDQSMFNINLSRYHIPIHDIGTTYNGFVRDEHGGLINGVPVKNIGIFHFAGLLYKNVQQSPIAHVYLHKELEKLRSWGVDF